MSNELISNLFNTLYLIFDHNYIVIAYVTGFVVSSVLSLWKPNRVTIFAMIGFLTLTIGFEYDKHFVGPLIRQTLESVVGTTGAGETTANLKPVKLINIFLGQILPILFYIFGWFLIFLSMFFAAKSTSKGSPKNKQN